VLGDAVFESAAGVKGVIAGGQTQGGFAGCGVDHAWTYGEGLIRRCLDRSEGLCFIEDRESAGESCERLGVGDRDLDFGLAEGLVQGGVFETDVPDANVVFTSRWDDGKGVGLLVEEA